MSVRDLIGKELPSFELPVERGKIREFANAIGDDNPIYHDPSYAAQSEFAAVLAPPTFTATKAFWRNALVISELTGLNPRFRLHGEEEFEYFKPVVAGDLLGCKVRISDAYEKPGKRGGKMTFVVVEFNYHNQKGERVLTSRTTSIHTEGAVKN